MEAVVTWPTPRFEVVPLTKSDGFLQSRILLPARRIWPVLWLLERLDYRDYHTSELLLTIDFLTDINR